ncbi:hypothetical protein Tco_1078492 [Tanacetum coccineum]|uniref:Retrovirus-related Pol polyprotein from transposon TNT 1-94 n=1 Tax=Tanacetum coccineum TaxID=301880 RepID=A0ABQ5HQM2_9ASTR
MAMSSTEAEYVDAAGCCAQVLWIKSQLADYDVLYDKVPISYGNTSAISISNKPVLHSRTKHIDIRYHFIRDHILKGDIELYFVPTDLQLADIFTKPLAEPSFTRLVAELGMLNIDKEPLAYYYEYHRELWYSTEVDAINTITFTLSNFDKPLSFNLDDFSSNIGLKFSENYVSIPPKETILLTDLEGSYAAYSQVHRSILFSDLVAKLTNGKKKTEANICYTRYLSLIIEHLVGKDYKNDKLNTFKYHHISSTSFNAPSANEPKASTDKRSEKKKIPSSSKPKTSKFVRESKSKKQVTETQHAEESVATTDATKSLEAFGLGGELRNQPELTDVEKVHERIVEDVVKDFGITSLEKHYNGDISLIGDSKTDQEMEEVDSDLESMSDDAIISVSGNDDDNDDSKEISMADEAAADNVINKLIDIANTKDANTNVFATNASESDPLADKIDSSVPQKVANVFEEKMPTLLTDTLKNILPQLLNDSVKKIMPKFDKRVKKTIKDVVADSIIHSSVKVPRDILTVNAKHLQTKVDKISADLHEMIYLVSQLVRIVDSVTPSFNAAAEGEKESQAQYDLTAEIHTTAQEEQQPTDEEPLSSTAMVIHSDFAEPLAKKLKTAGEGPLTFEEAKLQMQEIKRLADLKAEKENELLEIHALTSKRLNAINDQLLKNLKAKFQWVATTAGKLGIPPPPQLIAFEITPAEKRKKRRAKVIQEVFVKYNIMVDGMHRNLVPHVGVVGSHGLVIYEPEAGIFVYNGSFDMVFQRESEFHLATTKQLTRIQNAIKIDSVIAREMYDKMIYVIEARDVKGRKIIQDNLVNLG